jgi:hypothetical protein
MLLAMLQCGNHGPAHAPFAAQHRPTGGTSGRREKLARPMHLGFNLKKIG